jgi:hypothetical protein
MYPEKAESWKPLTSSLKEQIRLPLEDLYDMVLQAVWTMNTALFNTQNLSCQDNHTPSLSCLILQQFILSVSLTFHIAPCNCHPHTASSLDIYNVAGRPNAKQQP